MAARSATRHRRNSENQRFPEWGPPPRSLHSLADDRTRCLVCVDAKTGQPCADFGEGGRLDLMAGIPRATRGERDWLNALLYSVQSPPIVFGDTLVTPMSISSYNIRREMPPGWMRGFDARTGRTRSRFHTIPQGDEFGNDTWGGDSWRETGKVGVWKMMSIDPERGYIYLPLNTAAPDYYGGHRRGANLFLRASSPSTSRPARGYRTFTSSTTDCGTTTCPPHRT